MILYSHDKEYTKFLNKLYDSWCWRPPTYSQDTLHYFKDRVIEAGKTIEDRSFILLWENEPVIVFIGILIKSNDKIDLLAYEAPCITIEQEEKITTKAAKTFLKEFDRVLGALNGTIWYRDFTEGGNLSILSRHLLLKGAESVPLFTHVIDLTVEESGLKSAIRKSYGSLINWGLRKLKPVVLGADQLTWEQMLEFRELHIHESGRETRSEASWRLQFEMVQAKRAFIILGFLESELVSAGYFTYTRNNCHYGSSASRRDLFEKPLFHSLMWLAILRAKELGCHWFEVGEQLYPNHPTSKPPYKKELGISEFKAGFGGKTKMFLDLKLDKSSN